MGTHPIFESDFDCLTDTDSFRVIDSVQKLKEKTETKMDFIVSLADKAMDLSHEEVVSFLAWGMVGNGLFVAPILTFILPAYYGRYTTGSVFPINAKLSWIVQESPAFFLPFYFMLNSGPLPTRNIVVLMMMITHYFQRSFIYALLIRSAKPVPISITFFAFVFCAYNGVMQGVSLTKVHDLGNDFTEPCFVVGSVLWLLGFIANLHSDHILRNLRKPGETGYKIPRGGLFEYVSAANYAAESCEWIGFAIAANTFPAYAFAVYTLANLVPRGCSHHQWYLTKFEDYPKERKAVIPFLL